MAERHSASKQLIVPLTQRVNAASLALTEPLTEEPEFMHAVLCQVGLPRSEVKAREFTRSTGGASMLIEAGKWFDGVRYHDMPLPYGTRPRLVLFHVCSEAVRRKSPEVEVERSASAFLERLGIKKNGESFAAFKKQMLALAACRMQIGYQTDTKVVNVKCDPIQRFDAWTQSDNGQLGLWPGVITLSSEFFETLREHAVPLDPRAITALQNSALALDTYTWLAHRLCRIRQNKGLTLYWKNLKDQFGQEYRSNKDFKREFVGALHKAHAVYPDAKIDLVRGGIRLFPSPPPIRRRQVVVTLPAPEPTSAVASSAASEQLALPSPPAPAVPNFVHVLKPSTQERAREIAAGYDFSSLAQGYANVLSKCKRPPKDLDEAFLSYARGFAKGGPNKASAAPAPSSTILLTAATLERAAADAKGWDVAELERLWRAWIDRRGTLPDKPDQAFLGFVRKHIRQTRS